MKKGHCTHCSGPRNAPIRYLLLARLQLVCRPLSLETSTEHSTKSEGMICPIALWRGRGCHLLNTPAQPKHDVRPSPLGCCFLTELLFYASLEPFGIGFLVLGCGWVREYCGKSSQFPQNSLNRPRLLAYWLLPHPAIESPTASPNLTPNRFAARAPRAATLRRMFGQFAVFGRFLAILLGGEHGRAFLLRAPPSDTELCEQGSGRRFFTARGNETAPTRAERGNLRVEAFYTTPIRLASRLDGLGHQTSQQGYCTSVRPP
jgi:hypothetical protein